MNVKSKIGGRREGAGRKPTIQNPVKKQAYIDQATYDFFVELGDGNYSLGVRRAAALIEKLSSYNGDNSLANHYEACLIQAKLEVK